MSSNNSKLKKPTGLVRFVRNAFGFNPIPLTILVAIIYVGSIFSITRIEGDLKPPNALELLEDSELDNFEATWTDLQEISASYHPYNSLANDRVHDYLASTVREITKGASGITIDTEPQTIFFDTARSVKYFEANNVLVKLKGRNASASALLVSAHYDSVPTGKGTTDDGVGTATMLGLLRLFTHDRLERTVIFNFNNNEEFGLLGAEAFARHPWAEEVEVFLNLEGAGSGGKAILLQTTDYEVAKHYRDVRSPAADSIVQQGFQGGAVGSLTDFNVYRDAGMRGVDIAFFKPRSWYHTVRDDFKDISKNSVAHMFVNAIDVARSLGSASDFNSTSSSNSIEHGVFFTLMGRYFVIFPLTTLLLVNIVLLVAGPIVTYMFYLRVIKSRGWPDAGSNRAIVAVFLSLAAALLLSFYFSVLNPLVIVSDFVSPFLVILIGFVLVGSLVLGSADYFSPVPDQKLSVLLILHAFWYLLLGYATYGIYVKKSTGLYLATYGYISILLAVIIGLLGWLILGSKAHRAGHHENINVVVDEEANEHTSLIQHETEAPVDQSDLDEPIDDACAKTYDWFLQLIVIAGLIHAIYYQFYTVLDGLHMTVLDTMQDLTTIYLAIGFYAALMGSVLLPFVHRVHGMIIFLAVVIAAWLCIQSSMKFPFNDQSTYKVRFVQEQNATSPGVATIRTQAVAAEEYLKPLLEDLPSVKSTKGSVECNTVSNAGNVSQCLYQWEQKDEPFSGWTNITVSPHVKQVSSSATVPTGPNHGTINIQANHSRVCTVTFDNSAYGENPLRRVIIGDQEVELSTTPRAAMMEFWKLDWGTPLEVQIEWVSKWTEQQGFITDLPVVVTCKWSDLSPGSPYSVPAYQELLDYTPSWVSLYNLDPALVKVESKRLIL